jgi:hypothetical protein
MGKDDNRVVFLDTEVAEELLELVDDEPGEADEDLLDEAAAAIENANGGLPGEAQQAVARGDAVAVGLGSDEAESLTTLIEHNTESDPSTLKDVARSLQSKLRAASKKARRS